MAHSAELAAFQALLIGVGEYDHPCYTPLPAAIADACNLATLFSDGRHCTYDPGTIEVLTGTQATRHNIVTALTHLAECTAANCTTVLYFSGHGGHSKHGSIYLLPFDSDPTALEETAIPEELFSRLVAQITTQRVVVILDACHANGAVVLKGTEQQAWHEGLPAAFHERLSEGAGRVVIASSREDQLSYASPTESHFTKLILAGLRGAAARPKQPFISILDLYHYVNEQMRPQRRFQTPLLSVKDLEDFPLAFNMKVRRPRLSPQGGDQDTKDAGAPRRNASASHLPTIVPVRLRHLGFRQHLASDTFAIIPPTCDIPANSYLIGCPPFIHQTQGCGVECVGIQEAFYLDAFVIGMFPVTVAEFACAVQAGIVGEVPKVAKRLSWREQLKHPDYPVVGITWDEAHRYTQWLTNLTGEGWRLPTEVEWEAAARGPQSFIYPWADEWLPKRANLGENGGVMAIGLYPDGASGFGVHDLSGNVAEWTHSIYRPYPYRASDGRERDDAPGNRVQRGGSYRASEHTVRAYARFGNAPGQRSRDVGFRLARFTVAAISVATVDRAE